MGLESVYGKEIIRRGEGYIDNVNQCIKIGDFIYADVVGTNEYKTKVNLETLEGECSCPYGSNCKHAVAAYLYHKAGKSESADKFIEHLQNLDKAELIRLIVDNLPKNTEMALDFTIKSETNVSDFVDDFINDFSYSKMRKAEKLANVFLFHQLIKILGFADKNDEDLSQKIYEEKPEDEGDAVYNFKDTLKEALVKKIQNEDELKQAIRKGRAADEIIKSAEQFLDFKEVLKSQFSREEYLRFLLRLKNPDMEELKSRISKTFRQEILDLPTYNLELAERLGNELLDKELLFIVALKKRDCTSALKYLNAGEALLNKYFFGRASEIASLLMENHIKDERMAKALFRGDFLQDYSEEQFRWILPQINSYIAVQRQLHKDLGMDIYLIGRLIEIDREKTKKILENPKITGCQDISYIVDVVKLVRAAYGTNMLKQFLEKHQNRFATSSALKSQLKKEGISISVQNGNFIVEVGK